MCAGFWVAAWLLVNVFLIGAFDLYALYFWDEEQTVSFWVQRWLQQMPVLGVAFGVVIGHLAWPVQRQLYRGGGP